MYIVLYIYMYTYGHASPQGPWACAHYTEWDNKRFSFTQHRFVVAANMLEVYSFPPAKLSQLLQLLLAGIRAPRAHKLCTANRGQRLQSWEGFTHEKPYAFCLQGAATDRCFVQEKRSFLSRTQPAQAEAPIAPAVEESQVPKPHYLHQSHVPENGIGTGTSKSLGCEQLRPSPKPPYPTTCQLQSTLVSYGHEASDLNTPP